MLLDSSNPIVSLFGLALNIQIPWFVKEIKFTEKDGKLDICIEYKKGALFLCPLCGGQHPVHDFNDRVWRHLNFFQYQCYIHAPSPRVKCPSQEGKTGNVSIPWSRPGSDFTLLFEAFAMELANHMPLSVAEGILGIFDNRIMRIVSHYVGEARKEVNLSGVTKINL